MAVPAASHQVVEFCWPDISERIVVRDGVV
jgi:hypothetical protein